MKVSLDLPDLSTPKEAAPALRTSYDQLAQMRYKGTGPAYLKVGSKILYRRADLEAWLEGCRVEPGRR